MFGIVKPNYEVLSEHSGDVLGEFLKIDGFLYCFAGVYNIQQYTKEFLETR